MLVKEYKKKEINRPNEKTEDQLKKMRKEHDKMVKGKFEFIDAQGGYLEFAYRIFKDDPLYTFKFIHGEIIDIPMGVAKHLNNTYKKIRKMAPQIGESGNLRGVSSTYETISRVRFTPVDFL